MPTHLKQAEECWNNGQPLETGRLIFVNLPPKSRPMWSARILKLVIDRSGIQSKLFDDVLHIANREGKWKTGHRVFSTLRASMLELDQRRRDSGLSESEQLLSSILSLAELVAKVIYNSTDPRDEFDEDSGWWVAASLKAFVNHRWHDGDFAAEAWAALCAEPSQPIYGPIKRIVEIGRSLFR